MSRESLIEKLESLKNSLGKHDYAPAAINTASAIIPTHDAERLSSASAENPNLEKPLVRNSAETDTLIECAQVFEAKAEHAYAVRKREDGHYEDRDTEAAWMGWRGAWQYLTEVKRAGIRLTKEKWADAILKDFQTENNRTKADEWEAAYAHLFKQLNEALRQQTQELVAVDDMDVEIAIAEAIQFMPPNTTYEEKGVPVFRYLKQHGYVVMRSKSDAETSTTELNTMEGQPS